MTRTDLIKKAANRIAAVTGRAPILDEILDTGFAFDVRCSLSDAQFEKIDAIAADLGIEIATFY